MKAWTVFLTLCVLAVAEDDFKKLPESVRQFICRKSDPKFNMCLVENFKRAVPVLAKGIPELDVPPLDPYVLDSYNFNRTIGNDVQLSGSVKNLKVTGFSGIVVEALKADPYKLTVQAKHKIPSLKVTADFDLQASFFGSSVQSQGHFEGQFDEIRSYLKANAQIAERDGVQYLKLDQFRIKIKLGNGHISIRTDDPAMQANADFLVSYFNNNPAGVVEAIQQFIMENGEDQIIKDFINNQFAKFPASEFLPE